MEIIFHSHANETHFHKKGCAPSLILKVRVFGTRKWPIPGAKRLLQDLMEPKPIVELQTSVSVNLLMNSHDIQIFPSIVVKTLQ